MTNLNVNNFFYHNYLASMSKEIRLKSQQFSLCMARGTGYLALLDTLVQSTPTCLFIRKLLNATHTFLH